MILLLCCGCGDEGKVNTCDNICFIWNVRMSTRLSNFRKDSHTMSSWGLQRIFITPHELSRRNDILLPIIMKHCCHRGCSVITQPYSASSCVPHQHPSQDLRRYAIARSRRSSPEHAESPAFKPFRRRDRLQALTEDCEIRA